MDHLSISKHSVMAARITLTLQRLLNSGDSLLVLAAGVVVLFLLLLLDLGALVLGTKVKTFEKNNSAEKERLSAQCKMMQQVIDAFIPSSGRERKSGLGNSFTHSWFLIDCTNDQCDFCFKSLACGTKS